MESSDAPDYVGLGKLFNTKYSQEQIFQRNKCVKGSHFEFLEEVEDPFLGKKVPKFNSSNIKPPDPDIMLK